MAGEFQGYCNDCGWYGRGMDTGEDARYDALTHSGEQSHNDVEVQESRSTGPFVLWRTTDGLGEDGEAHIH